MNSTDLTVRTMVEGYVVRSGSTVVDASSTVCLVESPIAKVLVDSGSPSKRASLNSILKSAGAPPASITHLVNTHLHIDHCGCNDLFENAKTYAHPLESPPLGTVKVAERFHLLPGIDLVPTPGHTRGCLSVFVTADKRYVICGDAIPTKANYDSLVPPAINIDPKLARRSMTAITSWAEVIIPGHGPPFEVLAKE